MYVERLPRAIVCRGKRRHLVLQRLPFTPPGARRIDDSGGRIEAPVRTPVQAGTGCQAHKVSGNTVRKAGPAFAPVLEGGTESIVTSLRFRGRRRLEECSSLKLGNVGPGRIPMQESAEQQRIDMPLDDDRAVEGNHRGANGVPK